MANPRLALICTFPNLQASRRHSSFFTGQSQPATYRPAKIGFVLLLDSAIIRPKSQSEND
jgi:hypothetical protein